MTKVEDMNHNGISLELMHINKDGENFDVTAFYKVFYKKNIDTKEDEYQLSFP